MDPAVGGALPGVGIVVGEILVCQVKVREREGHGVVKACAQLLFRAPVLCAKNLA
jgi:hypothetical protein